MPLLINGSSQPSLRPVLHAGPTITTASSPNLNVGEMNDQTDGEGRGRTLSFGGKSGVTYKRQFRSQRSTRSASKLDTGWSWMIVVGAWLISFLLAGFTLSFTILYQELVKQFHGSSAETAWVLATYGAVRMFSSPLVSALCNAYSHRTVAFIGSIINSVAMLLSAYTPNLQWLYFIFGIAGGFSANMVYSPPFPVISYYFEKRRGLAMALASTGSGIGGVVMAPLVEALFRHYGYSGGMLIISGLMLNCCVASLLLRPVEVTQEVEIEIIKTPDGKAKNFQRSNWFYGSVGSFGSFMTLEKAQTLVAKDDSCINTHFNESKYKRYDKFPGADSSNLKQTKSDSCIGKCLVDHLESDGSKETVETKDSREDSSKCIEKSKHFRKSLHLNAVALSKQFDLHLLCESKFFLYCIMMMCYYTCFTTTNTFISGIAMDLGFDEAQVALMLTISYALDTPSRLISGALFDIHKLRHYHVPIMTGLGVTASLTATLLPLPNSTTGLFILWAVYQFLFNGNQAQQVPLTVELVGVDRAMSACGLARVFMGIGEILGPTLGGAIKDYTGRYDYAFYMAGSCFLVGCLVFQTLDFIHRVQNRTKSSTHVINHPEETCA